MIDRSDDAPHSASREEIMSALFANMIVQNTNMAFMFLGRMPHPETGELLQDLESARFFIDQLEMIEVKTRGNLDAREDQLLKQSLTSLRMAFVEAVSKPAAASGKSTGQAEPSSQAGKIVDAAGAEEKPVDDEASKKKFSKKY